MGAHQSRKLDEKATKPGIEAAGETEYTFPQDGMAGEPTALRSSGP
jgi:hypothetical protein